MCFIREQIMISVRNPWPMSDSQLQFLMSMIEHKLIAKKQIMKVQSKHELSFLSNHLID